MHKAYKRIAENPDIAILMIHGIVGTPNQFSPFLKLVPERYSVYNMLLDGHGKQVKDFSKTSMEKWEQQVTDAVKELSQNHTEIYIVAHSMGCLLAIEQAIQNPKITKLFLLAAPMKLLLKPKMVITSMKVYFGKIAPDDDLAIAAKACYGVSQDNNPFHYLGWIPRYLELFSKISSTRRILHKLNTPCFAFQSAKDEMVSKKAVNILSQNPCVFVTELQNSGHYYYEKRDIDMLTEAFKKIIQ